MTAKRCLVLGGSGALGRVVCEALAAGGARVAFTWHTGEEVARDLAGRLEGAVPLRVDLAGPAGAVEGVVDAAAAELGGLDAFVQCAGLAVPMECAGLDSHHRIEHVDEALFDRLMAVNVKSTFFACRRVVPLLRAAGGGNIAFTGSVDGVKMVPSPAHYSASKGALRGLTMALAKELGDAKILVNMVAPGILEGGISRAIPRPLVAEYVKHCGLKRVGRAGEVAALLAWLALENTYVTGQTMLLDGAL